MKLTPVKTIRATLLALFCSCVAQPNSDNMFVFAQYTSPPNCGASCYSERSRQRTMEWVRGSREYESRLNDKSQGDMSMSDIILGVIIAAGVGFGIYLYKQK
ncbi:hypothetical protein H6F44_21115 [Pseudanabaena sp. FACHB-1277]|uniref:Uncharacterized protein n=1 Tax=Pseudanabaena cinerea FACHB-1277 TaxID=2949581 RepID=A0A926Z8B2_9CYAN|nr:hypothetical protein [Pseudanabaena cinerea]MBD2152600.1 hypothetical protein [Pseudanabaena cinerea FACHB-1277]